MRFTFLGAKVGLISIKPKAYKENGSQKYGRLPHRKADDQIASEIRFIESSIFERNPKYRSYIGMR